jgi:hypothetical protein
MAMSKLSNFPPSPPTIPIISKEKKTDKVNSPDADKSEWIKLEFFMDLDKLASK